MDSKQPTSPGRRNISFKSSIVTVLNICLAYPGNNNQEDKVDPIKLNDLYTYCLEMARFVNDSSVQCLAWEKLGLLSNKISQWDKALTCFVECSKIAEETNDQERKKEVYRHLGDVYDSLGDYEKAISYNLKSLKISTELGDKKSEGKAYCNLGVTYDNMGLYKKAIECYEKDLEICKQTGDLAGEGKAYCNLGVVYDNMGQYKKATEYHEKDLEICKQTGDLAGEGKAYCNLGVAHNYMGEYELAMNYYQKDSEICIKLDDFKGLAESRCNIGSLLRLNGQYNDAISRFEVDLHSCKETRDLLGEAKVCGCIGIAYSSLGNYEMAIKYYRDCISISKIIGDVATQAQGSAYLGGVYYQTGKTFDAENSLRDSIRCYEHIFEDLPQQDKCKISICDIYINAYHQLTDVLIENGKKEEALLVSDRARAQALRDHLSRKLGRPNKERLENLEYKDIQYLTQPNVCMLHFSTRNFALSTFIIEDKKELNCVKKSYSFLTSSCPSIDSSGTKIRETLKTYVLKIIKDASKHVKERRGGNCEDRSLDEYPTQFQKKEAYSEESLLEDVMEKVTQAGLDSSSTRGEPTEHSDEEGSACETEVECAPTPKNTQDSVEYGVLDSDGKKEPTEEDMQIVDNASLETDPLEELYQLIFDPLRDAHTHSDILIFPDGPLNLVPFAALKDRAGNFLSETKRIRLVPSLSALKLLKDCSAEQDGKTGALIVGDPSVGTVKFKGETATFKHLKFAREEAQLIGNILGEEPLTGSDATKDVVLNRLRKGVAVVHIATHGDANSGELLLAPGPRVKKSDPEEKDYMLTMEDIQSSGIKANLVVLSCCHSGRGEIKAEGVVGLTRAFLAAGAHAVVASLWAVDDQATFFFMKSFYGHLKNGKRTSVSLQEAMREMRASESWSHPFYWAPFRHHGEDVVINV